MEYIRKYKKFGEKLESDQRSCRWFWKKYIGPVICAYPYFHGIVTGIYPDKSVLCAEIKKIINKYVEGK